jgi:hypothetical protein
MPIEPIEARHVYAIVYHGIAKRRERDYIEIHHRYASHFIEADSDDEARGISDRLSCVIFPGANGWEYRAAHVVRIDDVDAVGRVDESKIVAIPRPW